MIRFETEGLGFGAIKCRFPGEDSMQELWHKFLDNRQNVNYGARVLNIQFP